MNDALDSAQKSRREFLEKAGKLAVYTPPAIMLLSYPGTEAIASGGGSEKGHKGKKNDNENRKNKDDKKYKGVTTNEE